MENLPDIGPFRRRHAEITALMAEPEFYADSAKAAAMTREHQKIGRLLDRFARFSKLQQEISENHELAADASADRELREMAEAEIPQLEELREKLQRDILVGMLPPDPTDSRNTIMEIRAGTGGVEAALFASDLHRMYIRYAESEGWAVESLGGNPSEAGGFKEVAFLVKGDEVYKRLKFESGVHRVQRVPVTEASGRIHTSAATVAVLPEAEEVDVRIDPQDIEVTVARASGPGGQGVNTTDSAVQILHKPTGMIVKCADERSQLKNRAKALTVLRSRLLTKKIEEEQERYAQNRKSQVGSGDRSERIRTYNFSQGRVTDHRINLTLYSLESILEGELDPLLEALQDADTKSRLQALLG